MGMNVMTEIIEDLAILKTHHKLRSGITVVNAWNSRHNFQRLDLFLSQASNLINVESFPSEILQKSNALQDLRI